jgi:hypothetical protein
VIILHEDAEERAIIGCEGKHFRHYFANLQQLPLPGVKQLYAGYLGAPIKFQKCDTYMDSTQDGKYLILQGEYTIEGRPETNHYQQVYQRQEDGDYLIMYQRRVKNIF